MSHENLIFVQAQPVSNQPGSYSLQGENDQRTENRPKSEARGSNSLLRENTVDNYVTLTRKTKQKTTTRVFMSSQSSQGLSSSASHRWMTGALVTLFIGKGRGIPAGCLRK